MTFWKWQNYVKRTRFEALRGYREGAMSQWGQRIVRTVKLLRMIQ
jgi:hypothetical protein